MKNVIITTIVMILLFSCDSKDNTPPTTTDEGVIRPGIENVNGNIPETQNSISLDTQDSTTRRDSVNK